MVLEHRTVESLTFHHLILAEVGQNFQFYFLQSHQEGTGDAPCRHQVVPDDEDDDDMPIGTSMRRSFSDSHLETLKEVPVGRTKKVQ